LIDSASAWMWYQRICWGQFRTWENSQIVSNPSFFFDIILVLWKSGMGRFSRQRCLLGFYVGFNSFLDY
jgi:hypothetical protein